MPFLFRQTSRHYTKKSCKKYSKKEIEILYGRERVLSRQEGRMRKYSLYIYVQNSVLISFLNHFTMKNKLFCAAETNFFYVLIFEKGVEKA